MSTLADIVDTKLGNVSVLSSIYFDFDYLSVPGYTMHIHEALKLFKTKGLLNVVHMGERNISRALEGCQFIFSDSLPCNGRCFINLL